MTIQPFEAPPRTLAMAVFGIGALGCLLGAHLSQVADECKVEVKLFGHWPEQLATIRARGLLLEDPDSRLTRHDVHITDDLAELGPIDVAVVAVKSRQTEETARAINAVLRADGLALTLQNGLNNRAALGRVLGEERVALGVTSQGATVLRAGAVRHAGHGLTYIGRDGTLGPAQLLLLPRIADLFKYAGFETELVDNTDGLVWGKLAVNAAINPLTALLRVPNGFLAEHQELVDLMSQAAREVAAVAEAQGITLPFPDAAERALAVARATATNHSSMLQDVLRDVPTEIEAICGAVARLGRELGVPTPLNLRLCRLVRLLQTATTAPLASGDVGDLLWLLESEELR